MINPDLLPGAELWAVASITLLAVVSPVQAGVLLLQE